MGHDYTKIGTDEEKTQLPLSEHYQNAVIGWMEVDEQFFKVVINKIENHWFFELSNGYTFDIYRKWWKEFGKPPKPSNEEEKSGEILNWEEFRLLPPDKQNKIKATLVTCRKARESCSKEVILNEMEAWAKSRVYHKLINESGNLYNQGKFIECYGVVRKRLTEIEQSSFSLDNSAGFQLDALVDERTKEHKDALSFGLKIVDEALLDAAKTQKTGGLLPGDTTILLAPVNIGKTTCMITVITHNLRNGKKIIWTTHEGRESDLKTKLWCSLLQCNQTQLIEYWEKYRYRPVPKIIYEPRRGRLFSGTEAANLRALAIKNETDISEWALPEGTAGDLRLHGYLTMEEWQIKLQNQLIYLPMNRSGGTIEDTISQVRMFCDYSKNTNRPIHLWVDDYPGTVTTVQAQHGKLTRRERDDIVYGQVVDLAGELKIHALCAIQSNREAAKINKKIGDDNRLLTMEDVSESYGPMMRATNVISINRDPDAQYKGFVTYYVCKSRSSRVGVAIVCKSRYDLHVTHAERNDNDDFGGYWYEGTEAHTSKAEGFLKSHMGNELTRRELIEVLSAEK